VNCDQCQMLSINGVPCHETGCPNSRKTWVPDRGEWVRFVECVVCGCDSPEDEPEPFDDVEESEDA
jgi:hypothetical protein